LEIDILSRLILYWKRLPLDKIIIRFIIEMWGKMGIMGGKWNDR